MAAFVNSYPTVEVEPELVKGDYTAGAPIVLQVALFRDAEDDDDDDQRVVALFYPSRKMANWWPVVGEENTRQLHSIKRVTVKKNLAVKLEFTLPKGQHNLKLYVICDSYMGVDHDISLDSMNVAEGEDSDEDKDSNKEMSE